MSPWLAIGLVLVVAAFLAWYLWATSARRKARRIIRTGAPDAKDQWDALSKGDDPTAGPIDSGT